MKKVLHIQGKDEFDCFLQNMFVVKEPRVRRPRYDIENRVKETVTLRRCAVVYTLSTSGGNYEVC